MKFKAFALTMIVGCPIIFAVPTHDNTGSTPNRSERPVVERDSAEEISILARMGDEVSGSNYRELFIYAPEKLLNVEYRVGDAENWEKMKAFSAPGQFAYGTESYLPSAPGQKFTVRGTKADGTRVTYTLKNESPDGRNMGVKFVKAEKVPVVKNVVVKNENGNKESFGSSRTLQMAQSNIGRRVGNGTCAALRGTGQVVGSIGGGGSGLQNLVPGQVLRLSPGASLNTNQGRFTVSSQGHYIVVESINPDGSMTFLDQNWMGGSSAGQTVRRATGNLRTLNGSAQIIDGG
jgi:hypothetical protein